MNAYLYRMLWEMKSELTHQPEDINILTFTWNMARKVQTPDFNQLIPEPKLYDIIVMTGQEGK